MIGVIADTSDHPVAREFFELFKTPWEFYAPGNQYDVVVCAGKWDNTKEVAAKLVVVYCSEECPADKNGDVRVRKSRGGEISFGDIRIPIYGTVAWLTRKNTSSSPSACLMELAEPVVARIGYDLFREVRTLLTAGQPASNSFIPALDLHIALLRRLIIGCGLPLIEIPPIPAGFSFIVCLTHDLDHPSLRCHKFDGTMWGFLYRATIRSAADGLKGRLAPRKVVANWAAAVKLPLVYLGLSEDPWNQFQKYVGLDRGSKSTFFVIPFGNTPGRNGPRRRAAGYDSLEIRDKIRSLEAAECEIGVHGIDAWADAAQGVKERERISEVAGVATNGVRMHWLYLDEGSAAALEEAGFAYDSTVGYNETIGYRAGTTQAFRPLGATELLELPLHIMDTALFYRGYMNLTEEEAWNSVCRLIGHASRCGGVLTVNWHDRSLAPERLWGDFYDKLVSRLAASGALFLTGSEAIAWSRLRRSAVFEKTDDGLDAARATAPPSNVHASLRLRVYEVLPPPSSVLDIERAQEVFTDTIVGESARVEYAGTNRESLSRSNS
jgi:hypothetical protein